MISRWQSHWCPSVSDASSSHLPVYHFPSSRAFLEVLWALVPRGKKKKGNWHGRLGSFS